MNSTFQTFCQQRPKLVNYALVFISILIISVILELGFRTAVHILRPETAKSIAQFSEYASRDDTRKRFDAHPYLVYSPVKIQYEKNGIRIGDQFFPQEKEAGVYRIACLGASTTMNQYPGYLSKILNRFPGNQRFEVMDFGCDAWTSMETTINYLIRVSAFKPDFVIVHQGCNDVPPRIWPDFKPDYSHFRTGWRETALPSPIKWIVSRSWLGCFLMQRLGLFHYDLTNLTVRRVPPTLLNQTPAPDSLEPYKRNLRTLTTLVKAHEGKLIVAPMAYCRSKGTPSYGEAIEEFNAISRSIANENGLRIAETDNLLKNHPEWFIDQVHLIPNGNYLKAQVFSQILCGLLGGYGAEDLPNRFAADAQAAIHEERDIELRWEYDSSNVREYHIFVRKDNERDFHYMGRTFPGERKTYRWKAGAPQLVPILKEEFHEGPRLGHEYFFRVNPISKDKPSKILAHLLTDKEVKVFERPWEP